MLLMLDGLADGDGPIGGIPQGGLIDGGAPIGGIPYGDLMEADAPIGPIGEPNTFGPIDGGALAA